MRKLARLGWLMNTVGNDSSWRNQVFQSLYLVRRDIERIASHYNMTYEDTIKMFGFVDIDESYKNLEKQEIMDRINKRLRGEYVSPAWIASYRR